MTAPFAQRSLTRMVNRLGVGERPVGWALAACRRPGVDPELFFVEKNKGQRGIDQSKAAKAVCADCPARAACLAFALESNEEHGIWGGMTRREREALMAKGNRSA